MEKCKLKLQLDTTTHTSTMAKYKRLTLSKSWGTCGTTETLTYSTRNVKSTVTLQNSLMTFN